MIGARIRPFPTSVVLPDGLPIVGEILLSRLRGIDAQARPVHAVGAAILAETARQVRAKLAALIAVELGWGGSDRRRRPASCGAQARAAPWRRWPISKVEAAA